MPLLVAILLAASPARGGGASDALVAEGLVLRREHRDGEALEKFQRAYEIDPGSRTLAQVALAEQALGRWVEAEEGLTKALEAKRDGWIGEHATVLERALAAVRHHLGTLAVDANVEGAELWIDGKIVGKLPMGPLRVAAGAVEIELRMADREPVRRKVSISAETVVHETIELIEIDARNDEAHSSDDENHAPAKLLDTATAGTPTAAVSANVPPPSGAALDRRDAFDHRGTGWILLGGSAVLLTSAVVAHAVREYNVGRYNDDGLCVRPGVSRDSQCGVYRGRAETATTLAAVGYAGAGVLAFTAGIVFLTGHRPPLVGGVRLQVDVSSDRAVASGWYAF